ncbi:MAG: hypothetical protein LBH26_01175 [Treponema sp.]|jgi:hypothetical protein|nr:hypothetical protein [Treponema sp.]
MHTIRYGLSNGDICGSGGRNVYDVCSIGIIPAEPYKLIVFACAGNSPKIRRLVKRCRDRGINPPFSYLPEYSNTFEPLAVSELAGIKIETALNPKAGKKHISLPGEALVSDCFKARAWCSNCFDVEMKQYETLPVRLEYRNQGAKQV